MVKKESSGSIARKQQTVSCGLCAIKSFIMFVLTERTGKGQESVISSPMVSFADVSKV